MNNSIKKIIINACLEIIALNTWLLLIKDPEIPNSNLAITLINEPNVPAQKEKMRYSIQYLCHLLNRIIWTQVIRLE